MTDYDPYARVAPPPVAAGEYDPYSARHAPPTKNVTPKPPATYETNPNARPGVIREAGEWFAALYVARGTPAYQSLSRRQQIGRARAMATGRTIRALARPPPLKCSARRISSVGVELLARAPGTRGAQSLLRSPLRRVASSRRYGIDPAKLPAWKKALETVGEFARSSGTTRSISRLALSPEPRSSMGSGRRSDTYDRPIPPLTQPPQPRERLPRKRRKAWPVRP